MKKRLLLPVATISCLSLFLPWACAPTAGLLLSLVFTLLYDRSVFRAGFRLGVFLGILFSAAAGGAAVAFGGGLEKGLHSALVLLVRMLLLWLLTVLISRSVDSEHLLDALRKAGLDGPGMILGLSLNILPHLLSTAQSMWLSHRMRSTSILHALIRLPALAEVFLAHSLRIADEAAGAAALRGHPGLALPSRAMLSSPVPVLVLTGERGTGKTTALEAVLTRLADRGLPVAGLVQPAIFEGGEKTGFRVRNLLNGEEYPLAGRCARNEKGDHGTIFRFDPIGLRQAEKALDTAPRDSILVLDELGPVELRGHGHMPALRRAMKERPPRLLMLVLRRHLVPSLLAVLEARDARVVEVTTPVGRIVEEITELYRLPED